MQNYLLSCDWGTSSFRLTLYDSGADSIIGQVSSQDGIGRIYRQWHGANDQPNDAVKRELFLKTLSTKIEELSHQTGKLLDHVPVIISGMASSSIGLANLPYASLPFALDGSAAVVRRFEEEQNFPHRILLISGVRSDNDVMRGEETQLIGIWSESGKAKISSEEALFIFPGTHSKHIYVKEGQMVTFKTFMTGEMFDVIGRESILKDSISGSPDEKNDADDFSAFTTGVLYAKSSNLLSSLFTVRTNQLFNRMSGPKNAHYLSGLLIGSELTDVVNAAQTHVVLCGGKHLHHLYQLALHELGLEKNAISVEPSIVERSAMVGHRIILEKHL